MNSITGQQVAVLFNAISEEGPLRTTPTQSPRTSRHLGNYSRGQQRFPTEPQVGARLDSRTAGIARNIESTPDARKDPPATSHTEPKQDNKYEGKTCSEVGESVDALRHEPVTDEDGDDRTPTATPPPSRRGREIFSNFPLSGARDPTSRRGIVPSDSETLSSGVEHSSSIESAASEEISKGEQESTKRNGRKRAPYHATTPMNRRRPVVMRRKSSQTSSSVASSTTSPRPSVSSLSDVDESDISGQESSDSHSTELSDRETAMDNALPATAEAAEKSTPLNQYSDQPQRKGGLVEPDFRSKFVAKTRSAQSSFVSLPSLIRTPSAAMVAPASYQAAGTIGLAHQPQAAERSKSRVTFSDKVTPIESASRKDSNVEYDEGGQALPRTRSQLTFLLEKNRRHAGSNGKGEKNQKRPSR